MSKDDPLLPMAMPEARDPNAKAPATEAETCRLCGGKYFDGEVIGGICNDCSDAGEWEW